MSGDLYTRMKLRGVDMSWYERGKSALAEAIPLDDQECSKGSIYLMKEDGTVWTLSVTERSVGAGAERVSTFSADPHRQVRSTGKELKEPLYVCMHTKASYSELDAAMMHGQCERQES